MQQIATALSNCVRKSDVVARWGGDEFLVIAPYSDEKDIRNTLIRFRSKLEELSHGLQIGISTSSGYAIYP